VGPRAVLDVVLKRKIPSPRWESKPRTPIVQTVALNSVKISKPHNIFYTIIWNKFERTLLRKE
jgi:hypothetical protein